MRTFLKFCTIISIIIATLKLAMMSRLSPGLVVFIIICALIVLVGNKTLYGITAAVAGLVLFVHVNSSNPEIDTALMQSILTLAVMLFGIFLILRAVFPAPSSRK